MRPALSPSKISSRKVTRSASALDIFLNYTQHAMQNPSLDFLRQIDYYSYYPLTQVSLYSCGSRSGPWYWLAPKDPTPGTRGRQDNLFVMPTGHYPSNTSAQKRARRPSKHGSSGTTRTHAYNSALISRTIMPTSFETPTVIVSHVDAPFRLITRHAFIGA